jgi:hypothetical protein
VIHSKSESLEAKRKALFQLLEVADKYMKPILYEALLINGFELDIYDEKVYHGYMEKPPGMVANMLSALWNSGYTSSADYRNIIKYSPSIATVPSMDVLINTYIMELLRESKNKKAITKYYDENHAAGLLIKFMALDGGSMDNYRKHFGQYEADRFESEKILEFAGSTKRLFGKADPVNVVIKLKNINKLTYKLFRVDTATYYKTKLQPLEEKIDLDGLSPEETYEINFNGKFSKQTIHKQRLDFLTIQSIPQGLFIIELQGDSISSRMIVQKGVLQLIPVDHYMGIGYYMVDEEKKVCKGAGTGLYLDQKFYPCREDGCLLFPFAAEAVNNKQVVLVHSGYAYLSTISIPKELYVLKSAFLLNEEALVKHQPVKLVIKNKLYLNSSPLSLEKTDSVNVEIEMSNYNEETSFKNFKNLTVSDGEDLVLDLQPPSLVTKLNVKVTAFLKTVRNKELVLTSSKNFVVHRNQGNDTYLTCHLSRSDKGEYSLQLRGKTGEPVPSEQIKVQFLKSFGPYDYEKILFTDPNGNCQLGQLEDFESILVFSMSNKFNKRLFLMEDPFESLDIPPVFEICVGEKLLLPSLGKKLARDWFELVQFARHPHSISEEIIVSDCFSEIKSEGDKLVIGALQKGVYSFRYNIGQRKAVRIVVHEATRWRENPFFIEKQRSITELRQESKYLTLDELSVDKNKTKLQMKISSNSMPNVRVHVLGYHYLPLLKGLFEEETKQMCPQFRSRTTNVPFYQNVFLTNRVLSDEHKYILERQQKKSFIGNTLDKPSLLLHREKVRETKDKEEELQLGTGFKDDGKKVKMEDISEVLSRNIDKCYENKVVFGKQSMEKMLDRGESLDNLEGKSDLLMDASRSFYKKSNKSSGGFLGGLAGIFSGKKKEFEGVERRPRRRHQISSEQKPQEYTFDNNLEYLEASGACVANLKPSRTGELAVDLAAFKGYSVLQVAVGDNNSNLLVNYYLGNGRPAARDFRLASSLKPGSIYKQDYQVVEPSKSAEGPLYRLSIKNREQTSYLCIEDLTELMDCLMNVVQASVDKGSLLQKWSFLTKWQGLAASTKLEKLEELGGHELNVFVYFRDREFFEKVLKPTLRFKAKKELIDLLLLGEVGEVDASNELKLLEGKNMLELFLLCYCFRDSNKEFSLRVSKYVGMRTSRSAENLEKRRRILQSILNTQKGSHQTEVEEVMQLEDMKIADSSRLEKDKEREIGNRKSRKRRAAPESDRLCDEREQEECSRNIQPDNSSMEEMNLMVAGDLMKVEEEQLIIEEYQKAGAAFEFRERQAYYQGELSRLSEKKFWRRLCEVAMENQGRTTIVGEELFEMTESNTEVLMALTFAGVQFQRTGIEYEAVDRNGLVLSSAAPFIGVLLTTAVDEDSQAIAAELIISQKIYDPNDKYLIDPNDSQVKTIKEISEFLPFTVYECKVSYTNIGESSTSVCLITQIPTGSLPVNNLELFRIQLLTVPPMTTRVYTYKFYFPKEGLFAHYPATLMKNNQFIAAAKLDSNVLTVKPSFANTNQNLTTLQDMLNYGESEHILAFMETKNIFDEQIFDLDKVRWVLKQSPAAFARFLAILRRNFVFDEKSWAYAIYHGRTKEMNELLAVIISRFIQKCLYLKISDDLVLDTFEPLEYDPLVNPRVHEIQDKKHNIRNNEFRETYCKFLNYCCEKVKMDLKDQIILLAYLILQDRVEEAIEYMKEVNVQEAHNKKVMTVQVDYIKAYLSMYTESPGYPTARTISERYAQFPDLSWRARFLSIQKQLKEYDTNQTTKSEKVDDHTVQKRTNTELGDRAEFLKAELRGSKTVAITYKNVKVLTLSFYKYDMEVFFSKDPFMEKGVLDFVSITPNKLIKCVVKRDTDFKTSTVDVPEELTNSFLFVQVSSKDKQQHLQYLNSKIHAHVASDYGLVSAFDDKGNPVSSVYVKCYAKYEDGTVKFYKDGYTDFRGSFDYTSLNSNSMDKVKEFSLLVLSEALGARTLKTPPPSKVGRLIKEEEAAEDCDADEMDEYDRHITSFVDMGHLY